MGVFRKIVQGPKKKGAMLHSFLGAASKYAKSVYPSAVFEEVMHIGFEGIEALAPKDPDGLLRILYGDYMRIPSPEERRCKQHAILVDLTKSYEHYAHYRDDMIFDVHTRSIR